MTKARMACAAAAGCLTVIYAAPAAHAQLQGFGYGVAVNTEAVAGAGSGALQMPGETTPGSTFYGLGAAPNAQRLPSPIGQKGAAAGQFLDTPAVNTPAVNAPAASAPFAVVEDSFEAPAMAPAPAASVAKAPASPAPAAQPKPAAQPEPAAPAIAAAPEPAPAPKLEPKPNPEPAALKPPKAPRKKASADIPPAPKPKAAPKPKPAAVDIAAADPKPDAKPGVTRLTFGITESKPGDAALAALRKIGEGLTADEKARLEIRAYAGGDGMSANRARRLSLARALAVRSQLIEQGVRSSRIDVRALGDKTEEKPFNRVDLVLSSSGG